MRFKNLLFAFLVLLIVNTSFAQSKLKTGIWRGVLSSPSGNNLPFNFDVTDVNGKQQIAIHNGAERFKVTDIRQKGDSVFIHMPLFNSEFRLKYAGGSLNGKWVKHYGDKDAAMDFTATPGQDFRFFKSSEKPAYNITGRWSAIFVSDGKKDTTVGEFKQLGSRVTGTFLTTTGDDRFLEGTVAGNKLYLSTFDGGHAFLFTADIKDGKTIVNGKYYAGYSSLDTWTAVKDANAKLPDAYSLTYLKPGYKKIDFTFPDLTGKKVSLDEPRFKGKVVIVQMLGSWCPNCMDETAYLVNYYKKYHQKGVEIIGLAYERTTDFKKSVPTLTQLKTRFNITYPLLITGYTPGKGDPQKSLPMLADYKGFPTTIIIDKKGNVRKIHTGFSGPGTGKYYEEFTKEFEKLTDDLLAEK
ncbi:MAG: TlpA family protein disulfide reductase [Bacteroidetes bacterium]|jgi:thiol-disulfide isomerase/thioredoxin|nr:TlpA family protein disulfide reductase [Bacteroidota bacterium]